jgi:uncharacterized protein (TIGR03435 family)
MAYQIKPFQLLGAPAWLDRDEYRIVAKAPAGTAPKHPGRIDDEFLERLRALLAERFQLTVHREAREMPVYLLVAARSGAKVAPVNAKPEDWPALRCSPRSRNSSGCDWKRRGVPST